MTEPGSRAGSRFGPYQLVRLIGRGGMGEVYEAEDTRKHRVVALKLISQQLSGNAVFRERMQREADTAGRLTEPHVVPIHDYGEIDGCFFVEMRLINGTDLRTMLRRTGPLTPGRAVAIVGQIAAALDAAHGNGVTHRDVKPENILVTDSDFAYLVDFGIARAAADPGLTQTGTAMGTYTYMAPERFSSGEVTYRADIYSLACVLAESLTGSPPYRADSIERLVAAHLMEPAPRFSQLRPGLIPEALDHVIAKGMAKNPADRYSSAGEFAAAAHAALTSAEQNQAASILQKGDAASILSHGADTTQRVQAVNPGMSSDPNQYQPSGPYPMGGHYQQSGGYPMGGQYQQSGPYPMGGQYQQSGGYPMGGETMMSPVAQSPSVDQTQARPALSPDASAGSWRSQPSTSTPPPAAPASTPAFTKAAADSGQKRKILIGAAAVAVIAVVALLAFLLVKPSGEGGSSASGQQVVPFDGLNFRLSPGGVELDSEGNLYITNQGMYGRVVKLPHDSDTPVVLPFMGLYEPQGLAVDGSGAVYVSDFNNRVVKLPVGSNNQVELPITGLNYPEGVAVDTDGNVYVADRGNDRVVKLDVASNTQSVLPFTGLNNPDGVVVDHGGTVYITDSDHSRVLKLAPGGGDQSELPFTGLPVPWGITVDDAGAVYVTGHDSHKVMKLPPGATQQEVLPFTGLNTPLDVAVAKDGTVYVADRGNNRIVKLPEGK